MARDVDSGPEWRRVKGLT